jgi:hypothetical protein
MIEAVLVKEVNGRTFNGRSGLLECSVQRRELNSNEEVALVCSRWEPRAGFDR